ncbi:MULTISPECIES: prepilin-type N-terminal cleavage/methylation domain-containing protein [unclassified Exiguobacterium]|uniref:prepilin-type N-terminal cleavage/methylation domain-containing protein n=1 Tax=unclassified Exiguobacterium TaxID=2644629 RepID=UPI00103E6533|nr:MULTISPECIES: prepilin-type N-terminal cleavage/methylation domain-containing protein [unclassified Exiguobacterium]TCI47683.1 prepilin-type N-terminal cleavage/methylation domain-containing protein [Exiguobacterium sp. SH5S32]TCI54568.1 prepilin-type N-terminal cleavage/methylation domain-containing protein [Exiguobacterium sp. SH1S4]TCI74363.1 prepilin-type N-terminal cleavage/methylation domain-containing protein [Exiguobacterium sp. SH1S1]
MRQDGYTLVEMAWVLVVLSLLLLVATPTVRSMDRLALIDFTEALVQDIAEVGQYPYVAADEKCVPRLRWYMKERRYHITCGTTSITSGVVPDGVEMSLPTTNEIVFSKSAATYAGQWKFYTGQVAVTLKFRMGTYEPEVIRSGGG